MKRLLVVACIALIAMGGCRSVSSVTNSITGTNDSLLTQVPQEKMAAVDEAKFQLAVAEEKVKLAQLNEDLLDYQETLSEDELKLAKNMREQREIELDLVKAEVIKEANLVDPIEGAKDINGFKQELLVNESERIDIEAAIRKDELQISKMKEQIAAQEKHIAEMTGMTPAVDPGIAPAQEATEAVQPAASEKVESKEEVTLPDYLKVEDDPDAAPAEKNGTEVQGEALPE